MRYNFNLYRTTGGIGSVGRERLTVRRFKSSDAMYRFMMQNNDGRTRDWRECYGSSFETLKPGTYARAGGKWHNVKSLDPSALAHV